MTNREAAHMILGAAAALFFQAVLPTAEVKLGETLTLIGERLNPHAAYSPEYRNRTAIIVNPLGRAPSEGIIELKVRD
jgi:hypothetical protein